MIENAENARISLRLVCLDDRVPLKGQLEEFAVQDPEPAALIGFLKVMEFSALCKRAASHFHIDDVDAITAASDPVQASLPAPGSGASKGRSRQCHLQKPLLQVARIHPVEIPARSLIAAAILKPINHDAYEAVATLEHLHHWIARAKETGIVAVDTETTSLDPMQAGLCGVSVAVAPGEACYIPCGHRLGDRLDLAAMLRLSS